MPFRNGDDGPNGHRDRHNSRGLAIGDGFSPVSAPGNGMPPSQNFSSTPFGSGESGSRSFAGYHPNPPKIDFPVFDGEPKIMEGEV